MNSNSDLRHDALELDQIAEDFLARLRAGECPSIHEYQAKFPDMASEIGDLFPTLASIEQLDVLQSSQTRSVDFSIPEMLGEYRIIRELGRGGMGIVYEAEHETMRRRVALKVLPSSKNKPNYTKRFLREARAAGQLHHTNIVPVFEVGHANGIHFYAMQFIHGQNLDVVLDELRRLDALTGESTETVAKPYRLSEPTATLWVGKNLKVEGRSGSGCQVDVSDRSEPPAAVSGGTVTAAASVAVQDSHAQLNGNASLSNWSSMTHTSASYYRRVAKGARQVAEALEHAHSHGVLHRDIKPSNLLLDTDGVIWVSDFGLAKDDSENLTHTGDIIGTLRYMAPERFSEEADVRSDIYSLGLTLYELCTLRYAFDEADRAKLMQQITQRDPIPPRRIRPEIPRDLETIIMKSIAREPGSRYQSARAMSEDLGRFLADKPVLARRVSTTERVWRWCRRNPSYAVLLCCISLLSSLVFLGTITFAVTAHRHATELRGETLRAVKAERDARLANLESMRSLYESYVEGANASRWSRRLGQRFDTLDALKKAAVLLPRLDFTDNEIRQETLALRNSAIAAMPFVDMRELIGWPSKSRANARISDDGRLLAWSEDDGLLTIRDVDEGRLVAQFEGPPEQAWVILFDPTGQFIAAKFHDDVPLTPPKVLVWEITTGRKVLDLRDDLGYASFAFHRSEHSFSICRKSGKVETYSLDGGRVLAELSIGYDVTRLRFDLTNRICFIDGTKVEVFDPVDESRESIDFPEPIHTFEWSSNGDLCVGGRLGTVFIRDAITGAIREIGKYPSNVAEISVSVDPNLLIAAAWGGFRSLHHVASGATLLNLDRFNIDGFARRAHRLAMSDPYRSHSVWQLAAGEPLREIITFPGRTYWQVAPHPTEESIVVLAGDDEIEFWDIEQEKQIAVAEFADVTDAVFSPDGRKLFVVGIGSQVPAALDVTLARSADNQWRIDVGSPEPISGLAVARPIGRSNHLALDGSGSVLVTLNQLDEAVVTHLDKPAEPISLKRHHMISRLTISPDGSHVVTSTWQGEGIRMWNARTGKLVRDLAPEAGTGWVQFSPDGNVLIATSLERDFIWDTQTWTRRPIDRGQYPGAPSRIAFSPDSQLAVVWRSMTIPRLIDTRTGKEVAVLEAPNRKSGIPAFTKSGRKLILAYQGGLQVWDLAQLRQELQGLGLNWR